MKTTASLLSVLLATGAAGVAVLSLTGFIAADLGFATLAATGLVAFALFDYSRPGRPLAVLAPVLRPTLPCESGSPVAYTARRAA